MHVVVLACKRARGQLLLRCPPRSQRCIKLTAFQSCRLFRNVTIDYALSRSWQAGAATMCAAGTRWTSGGDGDPMISWGDCVPCYDICDLCEVSSLLFLSACRSSAQMMMTAQHGPHELTVPSSDDVVVMRMLANWHVSIRRFLEIRKCVCLPLLTPEIGQDDFTQRKQAVCSETYGVRCRIFIRSTGGLEGFLPVAQKVSLRCFVLVFCRSRSLGLRSVNPG